MSVIRVAYDLHRNQERSNDILLAKSQADYSCLLHNDSRYSCLNLQSSANNKLTLMLRELFQEVRFTILAEV